MPANENTNLEREPIQTRNKSASQERRNSVSDLADLFQGKGVSTPSTPMPQRKASGKQKEKERKEEIRRTKENIKNYIKQMDQEKDNNTELSQQNANGENQSTGTHLLTLEHDQSKSTAISAENTESHASDIRQYLQDESELSKKSVAVQTNEDEMLKAIRELALKYQTLDKTLNNPKLGVIDQLAKTQEKVDSLHTDIHGAVSGLKVQLQQLTETSKLNTQKIENMESSQKKIAALLDENKRLVNELQTMQGLIQKLSQQTDTTNSKVLDLTKRGMEQNLILFGVDDAMEEEDAKLEQPMFTYRERSKHAALKFFNEVLGVEIEIEDIWKAHRTGPYKRDKVRPLIVKLSYNAKDLIMDNLGSLKGRSNPKTKQVYFISEQIPEGITEVKKQTSARVKTLKEANE